MQQSQLRKRDPNPKKRSPKTKYAQSADDSDIASSPDRATEPTTELPENASLAANTETNRKRGLLTEGSSQDDGRLTKKPRIAAGSGRFSSFFPPGAFGSNYPTAEDRAHARLRCQLWTDAYHCLKREETGLVDTYERILSLHLYEYGGSTLVIRSQKIDLKTLDPEEKQRLLKGIIEETFKRPETVASIQGCLHNSKENLKFVKRLFSSITEAAEEVAFPWLGVCLALKVLYIVRPKNISSILTRLELLLEPVTPQGFHREAAAFLTSRMSLYWYMSVLLVEDNRDEDFFIVEDGRDRLQECVIELYASALSWQMKTICTCYQQQENVPFQSLPSVNGCKKMKDDLRKKEEHITRLYSIPMALEILDQLKGLTYTAASNEVKIRDMHLGNAPNICPACGNLDPLIWGEEEWYHTSVMNVQDASSECPICMVIIRGFSAIVQPLDGRAKLEFLLPARGPFLVQYYPGNYINGEGSHTVEFYVQQGTCKLFGLLTT